MRVTLRLFLSFLVFSVAFSSCSAEAGVTDTLLDDYLKATELSSPRVMREAMKELAGRIQAVRSEVPEEFFQRYERLVDVTMAVIDEPQPPDWQEKVRDYVKSITGAAPTDGEIIGAAADAFLAEVSRLRKLR